MPQSAKEFYQEFPTAEEAIKDLLGLLGGAPQEQLERQPTGDEICLLASLMAALSKWRKEVYSIQQKTSDEFAQAPDSKYRRHRQRLNLVAARTMALLAWPRTWNDWPFQYDGHGAVAAAKKAAADPADGNNFRDVEMHVEAMGKARIPMFRLALPEENGQIERVEVRERLEYRESM